MCSNVVSWVDGYENSRLGVGCAFAASEGH